MKSFLCLTFILVFCFAISFFLGCSAFAEGVSFTIPEKFSVIEDEVFSVCTSMTSVVIPAGVTSIGAGAFSGCVNLQNVLFGGTQEQWTEVNIGENNIPLFYAKYIFLGGHPASEIMIIDGKEFTANNCGQVDISAWSEQYVNRSFWHLENAYNDFKIAAFILMLSLRVITRCQ